MFRNSNSLLNYYSKRKIINIKSLPDQYGDPVYSSRFFIEFSDNAKMFFCTYLGNTKSFQYRWVDYIKNDIKKTSR